MVQLSSIIAGNVSVPVSAQGRLADTEIAQCVCNASVGALSTRQLLTHFALFQADKPHMSFQAWAVEHGLWATWVTKGGKVKPVGANERKAELVKLGLADNAESRVLRQFDALRVMFSADKETAERLHKMDQVAETPAEKPVESPKSQVPSLPPLVGLLTSQKKEASRRVTRLLSQIQIDPVLSSESYGWLVDELKGLATDLSTDAQ